MRDAFMTITNCMPSAVLEPIAHCSISWDRKAKKIFVKAMEERYDETFRHRSLGRNVNYKHLIKLECYKLLKDILGIEEYKPFKMYW